MSKKIRRRFTEDQKVSAIKRHLLENEKVSVICDELEIHPNQFYEWQRTFFENGARAFQKDSSKREKAAEAKIEALENKVSHKDSIISEIMSEHITLKKSLGEL
ncbi:MAG: transposase [Candidatus Brocadiaceae bacterium]|nr:transposase [Candidatus Brocadiaceae bacterium]MCP4985762.1 transposase [Colwellia sp.]